MIFRFTVCWITVSLASVIAQEVKPGERGVVRFEQSPIQSADPEQVRARLSAAEVPPAYDVTKEEFEVVVPAGYNADVPHGLFIWIGAGNSPKVPKEWEAVLAEKKLIFVGAMNSGNKRNIFDRARMAIDANVNMRGIYNIDGRRVYVSGFSGGSRVASMLGVCWGEMFSGTVCFMGVNFYTDLTAEDGKVYGLSYLPVDEVLVLSKKYCRYALVTGERDFNLANTRAAYAEGFEKEGFENAKLFVVPELAHKLPAAKWLESSIDYLDEGKP